MRQIPRLLSVLVAASAALVILAISITPFLSPAWVSFEQDRSQAAAWTGFSPADVHTATDAILSDLVLGPPSFDVELHGVAVLTAAERSHMRDVRGVFMAFYLAAGIGLVILVLGRLTVRASGPWSRRRLLGAVRAGSLALGVAIVIGGIIASTAFDAAFEVFHRLFFAAGTYNFDPTTDRLVQLFPDAFWSETTIAVGSVALVLALIVVAGTSLRLRETRAPMIAAGEGAS